MWQQKHITSANCYIVALNYKVQTKACQRTSFDSQSNSSSFCGQSWWPSHMSWTWLHIFGISAFKLLCTIWFQRTLTMNFFRATWTVPFTTTKVCNKSGDISIGHCTQKMCSSACEHQFCKELDDFGDLICKHKHHNIWGNLLNKEFAEDFCRTGMFCWLTGQCKLACH